MTYSTVNDLIGLAIQIENTCQVIYEGLENKFSNEPEIASYLHHFAKEEAGHARWLTELRTKSSMDELQKDADEEILRRAQLAFAFAISQSNKPVQDFEDAYQIANELEYSEVNTVFDFLITNYAGNQDAVKFLRAQLNAHMSELQDNLPPAYISKMVRRSLKAR